MRSLRASGRGEDVKAFALIWLSLVIVFTLGVFAGVALSQRPGGGVTFQLGRISDEFAQGTMAGLTMCGEFSATYMTNISDECWQFTATYK